MSYHNVLYFSVVCIVLQHFVVCPRKDKEKGTHPHFDVPVRPYPWVDAISHDRMASASAPANELANQLTASGSSLPPPAASIAEAVDLSAGAAILGLLLLPLLLLLRRVQASSPAKKLNAGITCIKLSFHRMCL